MDIKTIKENIKEILTLTEGQDYLVEGARNFSYTDSPTLDFYPSHDEDGEIVYDDDFYPQFSRDYKPNYVNSEDYYFPSSLNTDFACIAVEIGYYEGVRFYIEKQDDIEGLVYELTDVTEGEEDDETLYSYRSQRQGDNVYDLSYAEMYVYMQNLVAKEYKKGMEVLVSMNKEYGGELHGVSKEFLIEPESSGEEFDECVIKENFYDYLPQYASRDETMTQRAINIIRQIPTNKMFKLVWNPEDYGTNVEETYNIEKIVEMYVDHDFGNSGEETEYFFEKLKNLNSNEHFQWSGNSNMSLWDIDFSVAHGITDSAPVYSRLYMEEKYGFIHGWDSTALVNVAINIYDIEWDTNGEDENLPTEISEYFGLGESDMDFFAQQMSRDGYLDVDEIDQYMGDYANDLIDRFPYSTSGFSYGILNIKEVKDMITRYVQNNTEELSEPESSGEEFDECALNEELEQIINISRF